MYDYPKPVVSYEDDVFVWVYLDQIDRVLRYEAFVIDYDHHGRPGTLKFVIEEGVLDNAHEVPLINDFIRAYEQDCVLSRIASVPSCVRPYCRTLITTPPLRSFYNHLEPEQIELLHEYFATQEIRLKRDKRSRWMRSLRALGFDVVPSLA
ncbi:MAG: hypothetical protein ACOYEP_03910 [Limnochordia bacterium]|jgi:hypothetical protein